MTQGHHPIHTGLQQHSIGAIYPHILVGFGDDTWGIQAPDGQYFSDDVSQRWGTASAAITAFMNYDGSFAPFVPMSPAVKSEPLLPAAADGRWNWHGEDRVVVPLTDPTEQLPGADMGGAPALAVGEKAYPFG
jgi:hypothetical protein